MNVLDSVISLVSPIAGLRRAQARQVAMWMKSLARIAPAPEPTKGDAIAGVRTKLLAMSKQVSLATASATEQRKKLAACEAAIRSFVQANPKCTTCGANLDAETLLSSVPVVHEHSEGGGEA